MDAFLAIASKRDWRSFSDRPIPEDVERRILEAGRVASSANNRQHRRFIVLADPDLKERVAQTVYYAPNVQTAALAIAVVTPPGEMPAFDAGRAVEAMFLAAWNDGVASVPNGMADRDATGSVLGLGEDEIVRIVLAFGYPARARDADARSPDEWLAEANRLPFEQVVERR